MIFPEERPERIILAGVTVEEGRNPPFPRKETFTHPASSDSLLTASPYLTDATAAEKNTGFARITLSRTCTHIFSAYASDRATRSMNPSKKR
jgi:hypothetical protein